MQILLMWKPKRRESQVMLLTTKFTTKKTTNSCGENKQHNTLIFKLPFFFLIGSTPTCKVYIVIKFFRVTHIYINNFPNGPLDLKK